MKQCSKCKIVKEFSFFSPRSDHPGKYMSLCRACDAERLRNRYHAAGQVIKDNDGKPRKQYKKREKVGKSISARNSHAKRRVATKSGVSGHNLKLWADAQLKECVWCGSDCAENYQIDHFMPLALGGLHELTNLCISCPKCNSRKGAKNPIEWAYALHLEMAQGATPSPHY